jgi:hypothetical protein
VARYLFGFSAVARDHQSGEDLYAPRQRRRKLQTRHADIKRFARRSPTSTSVIAPLGLTHDVVRYRAPSLGPFTLHGRSAPPRALASELLGQSAMGFDHILVSSYEDQAY